MTERKIPVAYAAAADYAPEKLRPALEKVFAPQLAFHGSLHGKSVMLKPNLLAWRRPDDIACVHPNFVLETAKMFLDAGAARVAILENPAVQTAPAILHSMGIADELKRLKVEMANFAAYRQLPTPENVRFHNLEIASEFQEFDFVADLAKAKTHGMMTLTLAVKNLFGLVNGSARMGWHLAVGRDFEQFADMLLDLYLIIRPGFNFIDGIVAMEGNGPGSGTPVNCGFVAGAPDALALDASAAAVLGVPELLLLRRAAARGLLPAWENCGTVPAIAPLLLPDPPGALSNWGVPLPPFCKNFMREHLLSRPVLDPAKCIGCGLCAKMCPPQSLKMVDGKPVFNLPECIRCYCCQEHCPQGAIVPKESWSMKALEKFEHLLRSGFRRK